MAVLTEAQREALAELHEVMGHSDTAIPDGDRAAFVALAEKGFARSLRMADGSVAWWRTPAGTAALRRSRARTGRAS